MVSEVTMPLKQFQEMVDAHGADPAGWPPAQRKAAVRLVERSAAARAQLEAAAELDTMLDLVPPPAVSAELEAKILAAAPPAGSARSGKVIPRPSPPDFRRYAMVPLAAAAMALLWFAMPRDAHIETPGVEVAGDAEERLLYAFADPDGFAALVEPQAILPEDYLALAAAFEVPVDDLSNGD